MMGVGPAGIAGNLLKRVWGMCPQKIFNFFEFELSESNFKDF